MKAAFKNIFHNVMHIDFTIFCLQMSIQISDVSKQGISIKKQMKIIVGFNINFLKNRVQEGGGQNPLNF